MAAIKSPTTNLRGVLEAFAPSAPDFGEDFSKPEPAAEDISSFRRNLQAVSAANKSYFLVCVAFMIIIFMGGCFLVIRFLDHPAGASAVFGAIGVSFAAITPQMMGLWKKKVSSDMLLVLAGQLQPADLKSIVDVLLREYFKE